METSVPQARTTQPPPALSDDFPSPTPRRCQRAQDFFPPPPVEPIVAELPISPPVEPIVVEVPVSPTVNPVVVDLAISPPVKPIVVGLAISPPTKPIVVGLAISPPTKPIVVGLAISPPTKPIVFELAISPPTKPIVVGLAISPPTKPIVVGLAISPPAKPIEVDLPISQPVKPIVVVLPISPPVEHITFELPIFPPVKSIVVEVPISPPVNYQDPPDQWANWGIEAGCSQIVNAPAYLPLPTSSDIPQQSPHEEPGVLTASPGLLANVGTLKEMIEIAWQKCQEYQSKFFMWCYVTPLCTQSRAQMMVDGNLLGITCPPLGLHSTWVDSSA